MTPRKGWMAAVVLAVVGLGVLWSWMAFIGCARAEDKTVLLTAKEVDEARADLNKMPEPQAFILISKVIRPSVVSVITKRTPNVQMQQMPDSFGDEWPFDMPNPFKDFQKRFKNQPQQEKVVALGSGVVVDKEGRVLTNNHVIDGAQDITVVFPDESKYKATLVGTDPKSDIAVIKMKDCPADRLVPAMFADSDKAQVGQWVLAVGAPFGLTQSVSAGIISAKGRNGVGVIPNEYRYEDFIQTDAAINHGNSGGPLVDYHANVVGINAAIATETGEYAGVGFAIPSNMAKSVMQQLISKGKVVRGYLGVEIRRVTEDDVKTLKLPKREGIYINKVYDDTPASKAGLKEKDVIVAINGKPSERVEPLRETIAETAPGQKVKLDIIRGGKPETVDVTIEEQPSEAPTVAEGAFTDKELGITVQTLTADLAGALGLAKGEKGVVVMGLDGGGLADKAGIKIRDLITQVANKPVADTAEYRDARKGMSVEKGVLLTVKSGGNERLVLVK